MDRQTGHTILEIVIVLFVASILILGAISGNYMISMSTAKKLVAEMREVQEMLYVYRTRYRAIPGDDEFASVHIAGATDTWSPRNKGSSIYEGGNALIDGNGNWTSQNDPADYESAMFWHHVRLAGLAEGDPSFHGAFNAIGGHLGVTSGTRIPTRPAGVRGLFNVCSSRISGDVARLMDAEADDGNATTGMMWGAPEPDHKTVVTTATAPQRYLDERRYTVCMAF